MLDREMVDTAQHRRGFEACDLISPDGDLIHVKHVPRSSAASHLFQQRPGVARTVANTSWGMP